MFANGRELATVIRVGSQTVSVVAPLSHAVSVAVIQSAPEETVAVAPFALAAVLAAPMHVHVIPRLRLHVAVCLIRSLPHLAQNRSHLLLLPVGARSPSVQHPLLQLSISIHKSDTRCQDRPHQLQDLVVSPRLPGELLNSPWAKHVQRCIWRHRLNRRATVSRTRTGDNQSQNTKWSPRGASPPEIRTRCRTRTTVTTDVVGREWL